MKCSHSPLYVLILNILQLGGLSVVLYNLARFELESPKQEKLSRKPLQIKCYIIRMNCCTGSGVEIGTLWKKYTYHSETKVKQMWFLWALNMCKSSLHKQATIYNHQVTTMLSTSDNIWFPGHNHWYCMMTLHALVLGW